jgi:RNA polymerase sigma factor (sigma-70 family)
MALTDLDAQRQLLHDCWSKKRGAWEEFVAQYSRLIYYSIQRTCRLKSYPVTPEELEDLFNEVFVQILKEDCKKLRQYRGDRGCSVATWLRTIAGRHVLDHIRRSGRSYLRVDFESEADEALANSSLLPPSGVNSPEEALLAREQEEVVAQAVSELSGEDRRFIELYYLQELSPEEVARALRVTVSTVYSRVNRLKSKISEQIQARASSRALRDARKPG